MSTPNMGLVLPVDGGSANVWDTILDTVFTTIDAHDHTAGKGVQVPSAGININNNLSFHGFALELVTWLQFIERGGTPPDNDSLWVQSPSHNLFFRNSSGVDVQITAGNTLNVSIVGGIGGDYASVGALLSYDDATRRYLLQQEGSPRPWAGLATADIDLYQKAASITNKVTLKSPNALGASYSVTFPGALPASTAALAISSAGQLQFGFGQQTLQVHGSDFVPIAAGTVSHGSVSNGGKVTLNSGTGVNSPLKFPQGTVIKAIRIFMQDNATGPTTFAARFVSISSTGTATTIASSSTSAGSGANQTLTIGSLNTTFAASTTYEMVLDNVTGSANSVLYGAEVDYIGPQL